MFVLFNTDSLRAFAVSINLGNFKIVNVMFKNVCACEIWNMSSNKYQHVSVL